MKTKIVIILFGILLCVTCNKPDGDTPTSDVAQLVSVESAQLLCNKDLVWLKDIIKKAEEDKATKQHNGNYYGSIYLIIYKDEPLFLVRMMMGSGALAGYVFTCAGTRVYPDPVDFENSVQTKGKLIYKNTL